MATYNKNEMLPQRKEALENWSHCIQGLIARDEIKNHKEKSKIDFALNEYN